MKPGHCQTRRARFLPINSLTNDISGMNHAPPDKPAGTAAKVHSITLQPAIANQDARRRRSGFSMPRRNAGA